MKFTAVSFAHGVRKIFFHAGICGSINGPDAGGVLFEYGGTPRRMYAGVAALTKSRDGFELAEIDLRLRGSGELLGTQQSGFSDLRALDPIEDLALLQEVRHAVSKEQS